MGMPQLFEPKMLDFAQNFAFNTDLNDDERNFYHPIWGIFPSKSKLLRSQAHLSPMANTNNIPELPLDLVSLKSYANYRDKDHELLPPLQGLINESLEEILDIFYRKVLDNPTARAVFEHSGTSVESLKVTLRQWIRDLVATPLNDASFARQRRIGARHVEVALPHSFMILGMTLLKSLLSRFAFVAWREHPRKAERCRAHLETKCDLLLAIMLKSYEEDRERLHRDHILMENENILAMGRMSASIAHEIKNPLAGIHGAVTVLHGRTPEDSGEREIMSSVIEQVQRLSGTVSDLLEFARPVSPKARDISVGDLVDSLKVLDSDPDFNCIVGFQDPKHRGCLLHVDPLLMQNVLLNLFLNARDAGATELTLEVLRSDEGVTLTVRDNGPGVPDKLAEDLFKPFVTGKVHGTGLGLAICRKVIRTHGGRITYSGHSEGAAFDILLPVSGISS